jgi:hypothetical protein
MKTTKLLLSTLVLLAVSSPARAGETEVFLARYSPDSIEFNGEVDDWQDAGYSSIRLSEDEVVFGKEGWTGEEDGMLKVFFAYDEQYLYMGMRGKDDKHVRTSKFEAGEDHVEIWIKVPSPDKEDLHVLAYFPGRRFPTAKGGVRWLDPGTGKSKAVAGVKFWEKFESNVGWEAEIRVPWKSMPDVWKRLPETAWAAASFDTDNYHIRVKESVLATGWKDDRPQLQPVQVEDVENVAAQFLKDVVSNAQAVTRHYADVAMDGRVEVILQADNTFAVLGHGYKDGQGFVFITLPVSNVKHIESFELRDLTDDGRSELVFKYKQTGGSWTRRLMAVYGFRGEDVSRLLLQEIEKKAGGNSAASKVEILEGELKGKTMIKVSAGEVKGWTKDTFKDDVESDVYGLVVPWMQETSAYYVFREGGFEKEDTAAVEKYLASPKKKPKGKGKGKKKK